MRVTTRRTSILVVAIAAAFACACGKDNPTSPSAARPVAADAARTLLGAPVTVNTLQRTTPLAAPIVVSQTVGVLGGVIVVPAAGLTIVVPPLAVSKATTITVTALAGSTVAYEFAPAGTKFLLPLVVTQDFSHTNTAGLNLSLFQGGYFKNASDIDPAGTATVSELLHLSVTLAPLVGVFTISHFSGYLVSTGLEGRDE